MVGRGILRECLLDPSVENVVSAIRACHSMTNYAKSYTKTFLLER